MSHIGTPEWQSFELRMLERARVHRAAKRRRRMRHTAVAAAFVLLAGAAGAYVGAGAATPDAAGGYAGYFERGIDYLRTGSGQLDRYFEILNAPPGPAVRRPGLPFVPRGFVPPPLPAPLLDSQSGLAILEPPPQLALVDPRERAGSPDPRERPTNLESRERPVKVEPRESPSNVAPREPARNPEVSLPVSRPVSEPPRPRVLSPPRASAPSPSPSRTSSPAVASRSPADPERSVATTGYRPPPPPLEPVAPPSAAAVDVAPSPRPSSTETATSFPPPIDHRPTIRQTIERYRLAYERLDATAARAVWPGVEEAALARAFESLSSQRLTFENCSVEVAGTTATVSCRGTARVVPRVGGGSEATRRTWTFRLRQTGDRWLIESTQIK